MLGSTMEKTEGEERSRNTKAEEANAAYDGICLDSNPKLQSPEEHAADRNSNATYDEEGSFNY
jgi:hypothetical protein